MLSKIQGEKKLKDIQKKELITEIMKKIHESKGITAQEEEFVKRLEAHNNEGLIIKKKKNKNLTETMSNVILKHKNALNLHKLAHHLNKKPMDLNSSNNSQPKNATINRKKSTISINAFKSQMGIFGILATNTKTQGSPMRKSEKFKTENFMMEVREKVNVGNERIKDEIDRGLNRKNDSNYVTRERKLKYFQFKLLSYNFLNKIILAMIIL